MLHILLRTAGHSVHNLLGGTGDDVLVVQVLNILATGLGESQRNLLLGVAGLEQGLRVDHATTNAAEVHLSAGVVVVGKLNIAGCIVGAGRVEVGAGLEVGGEGAVRTERGARLGTEGGATVSTKSGTAVSTEGRTAVGTEGGSIVGIEATALAALCCTN